VEVGPYRITGVIGEGAAAIVYRGSDGARDVAVKVLRTPDAELGRRFEREARIAQRIESPHVAPVLDSGPGWIALPLFRESLAERIRRDGALGLTETARLAAQIAAGIDALHRLRVLHRDVKPSNVLLDARGDAAVADFGLARGDDSTQLTRDGQLVGTAHYLAPELIEGRPASPATDVYAFGCLVFECLTGAPPFAGRGEAEIGFAHLVEDPPDPRTRVDDLPQDAALAVLTALQKDPTRRPTTATALARMLHLAGTPSPS
jgi:serine/threonine-protein kinase